MELVEKLIKLNILYVREMERRKVIKLKNMGQLTEPLGTHSQNLTVGKAVKYLKEKIERDSKIECLREDIIKLEEEINNSKIENYKFWNGPKTKEEKELDSLAIKRLFYMDTPFVSIADASEIIGISESAIKQACQQERLLNTRKIGKSWAVHMPECRSYWNISDTDETHLYKSWEY